VLAGAGGPHACVAAQLPGLSGVVSAGLPRLTVGRRLLTSGALAGTSAPGEGQDDRQDQHEDSRQTEEKNDVAAFNHGVCSILTLRPAAARGGVLRFLI